MYFFTVVHNRFRGGVSEITTPGHLPPNNNNKKNNNSKIYLKMSVKIYDGAGN